VKADRWGFVPEAAFRTDEPNLLQIALDVRSVSPMHQAHHGAKPDFVVSFNALSRYDKSGF
jgi:hypothetical protein